MLSFRRLVSWILILVALFGTFVLAYFSYPTPVDNGVNVCLHLSDYDNQTVSYLNDLRVRWVRTDWIVTPDALMKVYSQNLEDNGINLLAIIDTNTFLNQDYTLEEWNKTITEIVTSDGFNNTDAVEIWNEPNGGAFIPAETYYEMLKSACAIIKNYVSIPVVFAGVSPNIGNWQTYVNTVFAHEDVQNHFDYMGIHLYDDVTTNQNTLQFVKNLTDKPTWLTETGKPSENGDETEQAAYLSSIYSTFKPLVSKIFVYELKDTDTYGLFPDTENHFGLLTINDTKKRKLTTFFGNLTENERT